MGYTKLHPFSSMNLSQVNNHENLLTFAFYSPMLSPVEETGRRARGRPHCPCDSPGSSFARPDSLRRIRHPATLPLPLPRPRVYCMADHTAKIVHVDVDAFFASVEQ